MKVKLNDFVPRIDFVEIHFFLWLYNNVTIRFILGKIYLKVFYFGVNINS